MKVSLALFVSFGLASLHADEFELQRILNSALSPAHNRILPTDHDFDAILEATIPTLDQQAATRLSALASKCLKSPEFEVQRFGVSYFGAVSLTRMDSGVLLEDAIGDLIAFFAKPNPANERLRGFALMSIFVLKPRMPDKAVKGLVSQLESKELAEPWVGSIAELLIMADPSDAGMLRMVLARVKRFHDPKNAIPFIHGLGLEQSGEKHPEAFAFLRECLQSKDGHIRMATVEAVGRLSFNTRSSLLYRLGEISRDEHESEETRSRAAAALR